MYLFHWIYYLQSTFTIYFILDSLARTFFRNKDFEIRTAGVRPLLHKTTFRTGRQFATIYIFFAVV